MGCIALVRCVLVLRCGLAVVECIRMQAEVLVPQPAYGYHTTPQRNTNTFHGLYCSGSLCVGVTLWFGCGGVYPYAG